MTDHRTPEDGAPACRVLAKDASAIYHLQKRVQSKDEEITRLTEQVSSEYCRGRDAEKAARADVENAHITRLTEELERHQDAMHSITEWARAYPLQIFPERRTGNWRKTMIGESRQEFENDRLGQTGADNARKRETLDLHFALGALIALAHVRASGAESMGQEIRSAFGDEPLRAAAKYSGAQQDVDTLQWLGIKP